MASPSTLDALKEALMRRSGSGARYGLERMEAGIAALGHPERAVPCVHVAGTNGKGSVCAMVEAMARAEGLRTATFTSPHLTRLAERIRIDGEPIDDAALEDALARVLADRVPWLTFFESMTAAFFVAARAAAVDFAVVEVGLGGRLDATNLIPPPRAAAIVSVSRDHTAILGEELAAIAREKAAIAKPGSPLVVGPLADEAFEAVIATAQAAGAGPVIAVARDKAEARRRQGLEMVRVEQRGAGVVVAWGERELVARPALAAPYQLGNVGVAVALGWRLGWSNAAVVRGLETTSWPGRFERIRRDGVEILLDCAHNEDGAAALAAALGEVEPSVLIFGAMADKPWPTMLDFLAPRARARIYTAPIPAIAERGPADLRAMARRHPGEGFADPAEALARALNLSRPGDTIVVAGSIFLVGTLRATLLDLERDVLLPM
jgi:dihydrofolate synthase / folylpolyglutamate synthase